LNALFRDTPLAFSFCTSGGQVIDFTKKEASGASLKRALKMQLSCVEITLVGHSSQKL